MKRRMVSSKGSWTLVCSVVLAGSFLLSTTSQAQVPSSIAGLVTDATGGVLPGVTVVASSPVLIEQSRTVFTDGEGRYNIIDLRPGTYVVTFSLVGFSTVQREGISLASGFAASINAEMTVGSLEETVTVSGESPVVDVQTTRAAQVLTREVMETVPSARGFASFIQLTPGIKVSNPAFQDVGGNQNENAQSGAIWGGRSNEFKISFDGMHAGNLLGAGGGRSRGIMLNMATVEESNLNLGGAGAEHEVAGVLVNLVPREGGNSFSGSFLTNYTNDSLQSDNLTQSVIDRGLKSVNKIHRIFELNGTLGGPIVQDKVWFFVSWRYWGKDKKVGGLYWDKTHGSGVYTPDMNKPVVKDIINRDISGRFTWQASQKNKFNFYHTDENIDMQEVVDVIPTAPEAANRYVFYPDKFTGMSWTNAASSRLLLEAGVQGVVHHYHVTRQPMVQQHIAMQEMSTGFRYNAANGYSRCCGGYGPSIVDHISARGAVSYVTGSHNFKAGINTRTGKYWAQTQINQDVFYQLRNGVPFRITQATAPRKENRLKLTAGMYAQDQWTLDRLTLNMGVRFDYHNGYIPEQNNAATRFLGATSFGKVEGVPIWKDISPRLGAAYDVSGDGRTAIKGSIGRYVLGEALGFTGNLNPLNLMVTNVGRNWTDTNGDLHPDCDLTDGAANGECGAFFNNRFGTSRAGTAYADEITRGFGVRPYNWMMMAEIDHELVPNLSVHAGYIRRWYGNFRVTDNVLVGPDDYSPYSFTAPSDPRLPGGGGFLVDGLYDLNPDKFGQVSNLVTAASNYGDYTEMHNFLNFTLNARFDNGALLSGGFDLGKSVEDKCFVVDSPEQLRHCKITKNWGDQVQFKMMGVYPLPLDFQISGNFQDLATVPTRARYRVYSAQAAPSLGRNLTYGQARPDLFAPYTEMLNRVRQLDFRLTKILRFDDVRFEAQFDLYNALNANPTLAFVNSFGSAYLRPGAILDGRIIKFGAQITF